MSLALKGYQQRALDSLDQYLARVNQVGAKLAFIELADRPYRIVPHLPEVPYVCLRVPTGGGKTIMAAHSVGIAATRTQRDRVLCLWLVPSNAIREQTLTRLKNRRDPYREALESRITGPVSVLDLSEALSVSKGTLDSDSVVIVATLAALRVADTEGRKIYEQAGALLQHFTGVSPEIIGTLERRNDGSPIESLANVLRMRRPMIVMDEAHNARTALSFETLERFAPSCIVEFTATPQVEHRPEHEQFASNVLAHVSGVCPKVS